MSQNCLKKFRSNGEHFLIEQASQIDLTEFDRVNLLSSQTRDLIRSNA